MSLCQHGPQLTLKFKARLVEYWLPLTILYEDMSGVGDGGTSICKGMDEVTVADSRCIQEYN